MLEKDALILLQGSFLCQPFFGLSTAIGMFGPEMDRFPDLVVSNWLDFGRFSDLEVFSQTLLPAKIDVFSRDSLLEGDPF